MATNQTGIAITIKAWLPTGKTLDEQLSSLTLVKQAHETSDYAPLLAAAQIEAVQTDSKTRRVEDNPAPPAEPEPEPEAASATEGTTAAPPADDNRAEAAKLPGKKKAAA